MTACFVIERAKIVIGLSFFVVKEVVSVSDMVNFDRQYRLAAGPAGGAGFEIGETSKAQPVPPGRLQEPALPHFCRDYQLCHDHKGRF